jgi:hypothetical protein
MTFATEGLRRHAAIVCERELVRRSGRFQRLAPVDQRAVADVVRTVADAITRYLVDEAETDPRLAQTLTEIYGPPAVAAGAWSSSGLQPPDGQDRG